MAGIRANGSSEGVGDTKDPAGATKEGKGKGGGVKDTGRDDGTVPSQSSSTNPQNTATDTTNPLPESHPQHTSISPASHYAPEAADKIPFLKKEYLAFQLRRLEAAVPCTTDSDSDETDEDTSEEENDWASTQYGSPRVSQTPTFLESEFARFHKQHPVPTVRGFPVSGSEPEVESDYYYNSDSDSGSDGVGQRVGEQNGVEYGVV